MSNKKDDDEALLWESMYYLSESEGKAGKEEKSYSNEKTTHRRN